MQDLSIAIVIQIECPSCIMSSGNPERRRTSSYARSSLERVSANRQLIGQRPTTNRLAPIIDFKYLHTVRTLADGKLYPIGYRAAVFLDAAACLRDSPLFTRTDTKQLDVNYQDARLEFIRITLSPIEYTERRQGTWGFCFLPYRAPLDHFRYKRFKDNPPGHAQLLRQPDFKMSKDGVGIEYSKSFRPSDGYVSMWKDIEEPYGVLFLTYESLFRSYFMTTHEWYSSCKINIFSTYSLGCSTILAERRLVSSEFISTGTDGKRDRDSVEAPKSEISCSSGVLQ